MLPTTLPVFQNGLKHPNNVVPKFWRILTKPERRRNMNYACFPHQRNSPSGVLKGREGLWSVVSQFLTHFIAIDVSKICSAKAAVFFARALGISAMGVPKDQISTLMEHGLYNSAQMRVTSFLPSVLSSTYVFPNINVFMVIPFIVFGSGRFPLNKCIAT